MNYRSNDGLVRRHLFFVVFFNKRWQIGAETKLSERSNEAGILLPISLAENCLFRNTGAKAPLKEYPKGASRMGAIHFRRLPRVN